MHGFKFAQFNSIQVFRAMQIVVITDEGLKEELLQGVDLHASITWLAHPEVSDQKAEAVIDLLFQNDPSRIDLLKQISWPC